MVQFTLRLISAHGKKNGTAFVLSKAVAYGSTPWDTTRQGRLFHFTLRCLFFIRRVSNANETQINARAALVVKLVDNLLRGRAQPSARHEAAAATSDVRSFVRAWRPTSNTASVASITSAVAGSSMSEEDVTPGETRPGHESLIKPSADVLLKLAQVELNMLTLATTNQGACFPGALIGVGTILLICLREQCWMYRRSLKTPVITTSRREGSESGLYWYA